jgi:hypothetical protein
MLRITQLNYPTLKLDDMYIPKTDTDIHVSYFNKMAARLPL